MLEPTPRICDSFAFARALCSYYPLILNKETGSERLRNLSKVTQLVSSRLEIPPSHKNGSLASFEIVCPRRVVDTLLWGSSSLSVTTWVASLWAGLSRSRGICFVCQSREPVCFIHPASQPLWHSLRLAYSRHRVKSVGCVQPSALPHTTHVLPHPHNLVP